MRVEKVDGVARMVPESVHMGELGRIVSSERRWEPWGEGRRRRAELRKEE